MQRYIINIKLQNLNFFLKLTNIKKTVVIRSKSVSLHYQTQLLQMIFFLSLRYDLL